MKSVYLSRQEVKKVGVTKTSYRGKTQYLVRIKNKGNIVTVSSFKKEKDANEYYKDILDGKIIPNLIWNNKKE